MKLLNHLQEIQQEIKTIYHHGDLDSLTMQQEISIRAMEYHAEKLVKGLIGSKKDDENSIL